MGSQSRTRKSRGKIIFPPLQHMEIAQVSFLERSASLPVPHVTHSLTHTHTQERPPPKPEFIYKKLCIYSYTFKLQSPSKYSLFNAKRFLNSSILMSFSASAIFLFHFFHMGKTFPFEDFFHLGKQTKVTRGKMGWTGRVGNGCPLFVVKHCWTLSTMWAGVLINHPSWNWQTHWKSLKNISLKPNTVSHNNTR